MQDYLILEEQEDEQTNSVIYRVVDTRTMKNQRVITDENLEFTNAVICCLPFLVTGSIRLIQRPVC